MTTRTEAATTTATLNSFTMRYQDYTYEFTKSDSKWISNPNTWPSSVGYNDPIDFYAYTDGTFYSSNPYVSFAMNEDAFHQKDFLVAKHKNISYNDNSGKVSLDFDHACAAVQFNVYKEENADYTVSKIVLKDVIKEGKYYFDENTNWQIGNTTTDYTLTNVNGDIEITKEKQLLPCRWLFIIPQAKNSIKIEVTYNSGKTKTLNLSGSWEAGKQYTVDDW